MATFLKMAVAYKKKIGFKAQFTIEPKAREPTAHQYDYDAQTVIGFLYQCEPYKHLESHIGFSLLLSFYLSQIVWPQIMTHFVVSSVSSPVSLLRTCTVKRSRILLTFCQGMGWRRSSKSTLSRTIPPWQAKCRNCWRMVSSFVF